MVWFVVLQQWEANPQTNWKREGAFIVKRVQRNFDERSS